MKTQIICISLILFLLIFTACNNNENNDFYAEDLLQQEVVQAIQSGRYASAVRLLNYLPDFPQADTLRDEANYGITRESIINEITTALAAERYEDVLEILEANPNFNDDRTGFKSIAQEAITARDTIQEAETYTTHMLNSMVNEMFQIATLEFETRNMTRTEVIPGGFTNPGTITLILEFDSNVRLGVANPQDILLQTDGNTVYIQESSIQISVLESSVSNFQQVEVIRSNPLVSFTAAVNNQIFEAQTNLETEMAERFVNERTIEAARRSFMTSMEGFMRGMGFEVIWT